MEYRDDIHGRDARILSTLREAGVAMGPPAPKLVASAKATEAPRGS